jgi:ArsR family metal-binding transcriptional regulator
MPNSNFSAAWVKTLDIALKAGVPAENLKGVNAFGGNVATMEKLNDELIAAREAVEDLKKKLKKAMADGDKAQVEANKYGATIDTQIKLYRKASFDMEAAYKKLGDDACMRAAAQLRGGLDNIEAMTSKNINLTYDFKDATIK